jgi:hypothetical protein
MITKGTGAKPCVTEGITSTLHLDKTTYWPSALCSWAWRKLWEGHNQFDNMCLHGKPFCVPVLYARMDWNNSAVGRQGMHEGLTTVTDVTGIVLLSAQPEGQKGRDLCMAVMKAVKTRGS